VFSLYGHAVPLFDESGQTRGSVGVFIDISDRKRTETAFHKLVECSRITGSAFFETVVRILAELFQVRYVYIGEVLPDNPCYVRTLAAWVNGQPAQNVEYELANTPCEQVIKHQTCFYPSNVAKLFAQDTVLAELEIESYMGIALRASNGEVLGLLNILHDQPLDESLNPEALLEIFAGKTAAELQREQAITELSQSEKRYRYLAESIPQLVWTANKDGLLTDINQRWSNFTGLTLAQVQTEGWQIIVHPDDVPILSQQWALSQQNGINYQAEGRIRRVDGVYRWHLHQAIPLKNKRGQVIKWFGTATDIEEAKQLEQQRIQLLQQEQAARQAAEQANRTKDDFLAILSHELRSPLNPILGWSKLLQSKKLDEEKTTYALATIERNAKLQTQLIDDLLDVAKILRGKLSIDELPINLVSVIDAAIEVVETSAKAKSISLQPTLIDICQVRGDEARLQQIVWNLLSNAIKFTPIGGQVNIRLDKVNNYAQMTIKDTGIGISREFIPHLFESFRQKDISITRQYGGLGLGLSIVKYLVDAHGGTITVDSPGEGQGSTFAVLLPLAKNESIYPSTNKFSSAEIDLAGIKVLAVDDNPDARELLTTLLNLYGVEVKVVASAAEVLTHLDDFEPDVLVCDISMPNMDGYTLLQQIRALSPEQGGQIPAIAVTAYARQEDYQLALHSGFQKHIAKPLQPEMLALAVAELALR